MVVKASCPVVRRLLLFRIVGLPCAAISFPFRFTPHLPSNSDLQCPRTKPECLSKKSKSDFSLTEAGANDQQTNEAACRPLRCGRTGRDWASLLYRAGDPLPWLGFHVWTRLRVSAHVALCS
jgi:hypothetical protein